MKKKYKLDLKQLNKKRSSLKIIQIIMNIN